MSSEYAVGAFFKVTGGKRHTQTHTCSGFLHTPDCSTHCPSQDSVPLGLELQVTESLPQSSDILTVSERSPEKRDSERCPHYLLPLKDFIKFFIK